MSFSAVTIYNLAQNNSEELLSSHQKMAVGFDCTLFVAIIVLAGVILANTLLNLNLSGLAHTTNTTAYILIGSASLIAFIDFIFFAIQSYRQLVSEKAQMEKRLSTTEGERDKVASEVTSLQAILENNQSSLSSIEQQILTLNHQVQESEQKALEQEKQITELQSQLTTSEEAVQEYITQIASLKNEHSEAEKTLTTTHNEKVTSLQQLLEQSQATALEQTTKIAELQAQLVTSENATQGYITQIDSLTNEHHQAQQKLTTSHNEQMTSLQQLLKQAQLKADEQAHTIDELHTQAKADKVSLKEMETLLRQQEVHAKDLASRGTLISNALPKTQYQPDQTTHTHDDTDCVTIDMEELGVAEDDRDLCVGEAEVILDITSGN